MIIISITEAVIFTMVMVFILLYYLYFIRKLRF
jgi:hypothetical protein